MTDWSGYPNGATPLSMMTQVRGEYFEPHAAADVVSLGAAFLAARGHDLIIAEGYRTLATQQTLWAWYQNGTGNLAAYPGTSIHGDGQAADFGSAVNVYGTEDKAWMDANAPRFGWIPTGNGFRQREPWHFEHPSLSIISGASLAGLNASPIPPLQPEDETMPYIISSPAGQTLIADGHAIGFTSPAEVQATSATIVTTTARVHNALLAALAQQQGLPLLVSVNGGDGTIYTLAGQKLTPLVDPGTVGQLQAAGASVITISTAERDNWLKTA